MNDLQQCILNIYREVAKILDRHNISYFGTDGTCLGAIRHGGFIPWDDDMDIVVPVEQIPAVLEILQRELPTHLTVYSPFDHAHYPRLIYKVVNIKTTYIEDCLSDYPDSWSGVWLDIIPLCGVPAPGLRRKWLYHRLARYMFLDLYKREDYLGSHFTLIQKLVKYLVVKYRDTNFYLNKQWRLIAKFPTHKYDYVLETGFFGHQQWTFAKRLFGKGRKVKFEDVELRVPELTDEYLTEEYGDYMQLPPVEKRKRHVGYVDLERPYTDYVAEPNLYYQTKKDA